MFTVACVELVLLESRSQFGVDASVQRHHQVSKGSHIHFFPHQEEIRRTTPQACVSRSEESRDPDEHFRMIRIIKIIFSKSANVVRVKYTVRVWATVIPISPPTGRGTG